MDIKKTFQNALPKGIEYCHLRVRHDKDTTTSVRQGIAEPLRLADERGAMVTVVSRSGMGYAATQDLTLSGLASAIARAKDWAEKFAGQNVCDYSALKMPQLKGTWKSPVEKPWSQFSIESRLERLQAAAKQLKAHANIIDWTASLWHKSAEQLYVNHAGGEAYQTFDYVAPHLEAIAHREGDTEKRTFHGGAICQQGGVEVLDHLGFWDAATVVGSEALELLSAPNCPNGTMELLLDPAQMVLQIHESIGHPLELDRILGDERNYAGTSFVTQDMFGKYQYGSEHLNITYDPTRSEQIASYAVDDEGSQAERQYIIKDGLLLRPLGGAVSQFRAGMSGVANTRAAGWNRPPIDRMANLNLEAGTHSLESLIARVRRGVYMKTNCSWSIDDSRNKFQFGCEWGRVIENGKLGAVVKRPNYRGISSSFWRNLTAVGNPLSLGVFGTPYCGKGEPNQMIYVGHATPACLFAGVDVFGGGVS